MDAGQLGNLGSVTYSGSDADDIFDAFRDFVRVHQQLLSILIGKAGFLTQVPFLGPPVAAVLRGIESVVDVSFLFPPPFRTPPLSPFFFFFLSLLLLPNWPLFYSPFIAQTIANLIIDTIQGSLQGEFKNQLASLDGTISKAIDSYAS